MTKVVLHAQVEGHLQTSAEARDVLLKVCRAHGIPVDWHEPSDTLYISAPLHGKTIVIDAGHGGQDRYQVGRLGLVEADFVQLVADAVAARLTEAGAHVVRTRSGDETVDTATRQAIVTRAEPWAVVSLHLGNRPQQRGVAAYVGWRRLWGGWRLAGAALRLIADGTALPARGVRLYPVQGRGGEGYQILAAARCPAVVFELGQLPSIDDEAALLQPGIPERMAAGLLAGLLALAGHRASAPEVTSQPAAARGATMAAGATVATPVAAPDAPADTAAAHAAKVAQAAIAAAPVPPPAAPGTAFPPPAQAPAQANLGGQAAVVTSGLLDAMRAQRPQMSPAAQAIRAGQAPPPPAVKFDPTAGAARPVIGSGLRAGQPVRPGNLAPAPTAARQTAPAPPAAPASAAAPPPAAARPPIRPPTSSGRQPFG